MCISSKEIGSSWTKPASICVESSDLIFTPMVLSSWVIDFHGIYVLSIDMTDMTWRVRQQCVSRPMQLHRNKNHNGGVASSAQIEMIESGRRPLANSKAICSFLEELEATMKILTSSAGSIRWPSGIHSVFLILSRKVGHNTSMTELASIATEGSSKMLSHA